MKKSEDIMRRSQEGKIVLKKGIWINISLFLFLILSEIINSQIPINGFCIRNSYKIPSGYEKILSADLNNDYSDEFIVYTPSQKKIGIFSLQKNDLINFREFSVAHEFSQIKYLDDSNNRFVCVSRKNRLIAIYEFRLKATPKMISKITFDSYPENISLGDINNDKIIEILVSGIGFDGISILVRKEGRLAEKKIVSGESFSQAVFTDLSNDGYTDITAFNIINSSTQFFYNNGRSELNFTRDSKAAENIEFLHSLDLNIDGFQDLIFNSGKRLNFAYGDFQSAYDEERSVQLKYKPQILQFGDYNNDKISDVAYINAESGNVNIMFGKNGTDFYDEITYTNLASVSCITNYKQQGKYNLIVISKDGFVTTISSFRENIYSAELIPAVSAGTLEKFDLNNDGIFDICFIDNYDNSFRILTRNANGMPEKFYSHKLDDTQESIVVDDFFTDRKTYYCYSKENQLIEFVKVNFSTNEIEHKHLYSPGGIKDLRIQRVDSSLIFIYLLYLKGNKLFLGKFEHRELSITFSEYPFIDRDVTFAVLSLKEEIRAFYWKEISDSLFFNEVSIKKGPNIYNGILGISKGDSIKITMTASNQLFGRKPWIVSSIINDGENILISFKENSYKKLHLLNESSTLNYLEENWFSFAKIPKDENESLMIYIPGSRSLCKFSFSYEAKTFSVKEIIDRVDIKDYFIDKFTGTVYHLVYSDINKGCISVVQLTK